MEQESEGNTGPGETTVVVTHEEPPVEHVPAEQTVVVQEHGDPGIHPAVAQHMAEQAGINERILAALEQTQAVADTATATAQTATDSVEGAVEAVSEIASEVSATVDESRPQPEPDQAPAHQEHKWYRKRGSN
jgi:hypothetical protein